VLGISASTLFLAALIPGSASWSRSWSPTSSMNRIYLWEGGGNHDDSASGPAPGRTVKSGWYAFLVPGIIFYGIFSGRLTPTEAGATAVVVTIIMGFILGR
jgi:C4-dicarboxylate transporter DctM subunit